MTQKNKVKIWTASENTAAGFMVTENKAYMIADRSNHFVASPNGAIITGKSIVFNTTSENIRAGGFFIKMNDIVQMIPTTLVTPMPSQVPFPPLGFVSAIVKDLAFVTAMMNPPF